MSTPITATARLRAELSRLDDALGAAEGRFPGGGLPEREKMRGRARHLINHYLEPRLADPAAPPLVGVFGPTGAGKSTLVNSLAGETIGPSGVIRPTTRTPVVWCHTIHRWRYQDLGGVEVAVFDHPLVENLTIVDTPDLDSYLAENRVKTESLLDRCDAAIFVTTPQRYADAVPWETLEMEMSRRLPTLVVVNRLSRRNRGVVTDLVRLFREAGRSVRTSAIVTINEQRLRGGGLLPAVSLRRVDRFLGDLGQTGETVIGTGYEVVRLVARVAEGLRDDRRRAAGLGGLADDAVSGQVEEVALHLGRGDLVKKEVVARWQRLVGTGDLAAILARGVARTRHLIQGRTAVTTVGDEARSQLIGLCEHRAGLAFAQVVDAWSLEPGLEGWSPSLDHRAVTTRAETEVDDWLAELVEMVKEGGRGRFKAAKAASLGVNAAATLLLVTVFAHSGGLTGAEVGVVAGAAAAQQAVFEHLLGGAAATRMASRARQRLLGRMTEVIERAIGPLRLHLADLTPSEEVVTELEDAARAVVAELRTVGGG